MTEETAPEGDIDAFKCHDLPNAEMKARPGIEGLFWSNTARIVHKWHHYLPIYERHFSAYRGRPIRFLEIGVSKGGSMKLWRDYFGPEATIFGIDIDPSCAALSGEYAEVRIGSQDDPAFLSEVIAEMGGVDVILDDGSHMSAHIRTSFETLFPLLSDGGVYMVEDLHATYWRSHNGGYQDRSTFMNDIRQMFDDMHHWYHRQGQKITAAAGHLYSMHLYDSIAVFDKQTVLPPQHSMVGQE